MIPRFRYLIHVTRPLSKHPRFYFSASEAVRFNADNNDEGPVDGFEQNRLYFGLGYRATDITSIEFGYLWRFQRERTEDDHHDHVLRLQFLFDTKTKPPSHGGS